MSVESTGSIQECFLYAWLCKTVIHMFYSKNCSIHNRVILTIVNNTPQVVNSIRFTSYCPSRCFTNILICVRTLFGCSLGLTHRVFRDNLLHTTVVMHSYLHYCHLPVSFHQSWPFSSDLSCPHAAHCMFLYFSHHSLHALETVVHENPRKIPAPEMHK